MSPAYMTRGVTSWLSGLSSASASAVIIETFTSYWWAEHVSALTAAAGIIHRGCSCKPWTLQL